GSGYLTKSPKWVLFLIEPFIQPYLIMTKRREFIQKSLIGAAGLTMAGMGMSARSYSAIIEANDRVNVAVIGINGMGQNHIEGYSKLKHARVTALCDVDSNLFASRIKTHFSDKGLPKPKIFGDL